MSMKNIKLYTIFSYYSFLTILLHQFFDDSMINHIHHYHLLSMVIFLIEISLFIIVILNLFRKAIVASSILLSQLIILLIYFWALEYKVIYSYGLIIMTLLLAFILSKLHQKVLVTKRNFIYHKLIIKNNALLTLVYIIYGLTSYVGIYFSFSNLDVVFKNPINMLYFALFPYIIIILILFRLSINLKTDSENTINKYKKQNSQKIIIQDLLLNILSILLIIL